MTQLQKRLYILSLREVSARGSIHGLDQVDCYFACMNRCDSRCNYECAPKCNIGFDAFEAYYTQYNAEGQTGYTAEYLANPC